MINRRELFTWWRAKSAPEVRVREIAPPIARIVEPTPIDTAEPFSLEAFYAARTKERAR